MYSDLFSLKFHFLREKKAGTRKTNVNFQVDGSQLIFPFPFESALWFMTCAYGKIKRLGKTVERRALGSMDSVAGFPWRWEQIASFTLALVFSFLF